MMHMLLENLHFNGSQCRSGRLKLCNDIDAVFLLLNHLANALYLPGNPRKPIKRFPVSCHLLVCFHISCIYPTGVCVNKKKLF